MATLSNTKVFSHADLKFPLPSNKRLVGRQGFSVKLHTKFKFEYAICALTTIESESIALSSSSETQIGSGWNFGASQDDSQENSGIDEKEILRQSRISSANKGNTPWNKGRKHSPGQEEAIEVGASSEVCYLKLITSIHTVLSFYRLSDESELQWDSYELLQEEFK
ncbi:uncharacterized protein LOC144575571 [Carex rostrata]